MEHARVNQLETIPVSKLLIVLNEYNYICSGLRPLRKKIQALDIIFHELIDTDPCCFQISSSEGLYFGTLNYFVLIFSNLSTACCIWAYFQTRFQ